MQLAPEDAQQFFKIYFSLLAFVSRQTNPDSKTRLPEDIPKLKTSEIGVIRNQLYEKINLLDPFIQENPEQLTPEELKIASSWRHFLQGDFYILKFLKRYTIFLSSIEPARLYGVYSLINTLEEVLHYPSLPVMVKTVLLPFKGKIIYDGLVNAYAVAFGGGIRSSLNEAYRRLKETEGIVEQLVDPSGEAKISTALESRSPKKPAPDWLPALQDIAARVNDMRQTDTRKQSAALSLLRSVANFAQAVYENPDDLGDQLGRFKSVRRSMTNLEHLLEAEKYGYDI